MHLLQAHWTTAARSWRACLWLKLPVLIGFFAVPPVSLGAYRNYGSVSAYMRDTLHWLPVAQRISYRIAVLVWRCLPGSAPVTFASSVDRYQFYLDAEPFVPLLLASYWCLVLKLQLGSVAHSLSIVGPSTWNGLPLEIRILPKNNESAFCKLHKTDLYRRGWAGGASELIS